MMRKLSEYLFLSACITVTIQCKSQDSSEVVVGNSTYFSNVAVIPMTQEGVILQGQAVLITDGKVAAMGPQGQIDIPDNATEVDGTGKFLVPGLAEMHAHIPPERSGQEHIEETLFLYLSNGVTTIRGMLGEPYHLKLKGQVASGEILGPRIFTSGPSLNGNSVPTVEVATKKVTEQKEAGYDFLKLHPGLGLDVFDEIVRTARQVGIPFAGHVSIDVGVVHALNSGYASIDHVDGYVEGLVPATAGVNPGANGFFGINFTEIADRSQIDKLVALSTSNKVAIVPTQSLMERWVGPSDAEELGKDPEMVYMKPETVSNWVRIKKEYTSGEGYSTELATAFIQLREEIIQKLHDGGVPILLGSDAPQVFNVPGFSIKNELESMVRSGLSPYEALESGTANPARFFQMIGEFGTIVPGADADLILLEANPIENISNTRKQAGVMIRGIWLPQSDIEKKLADIRDIHRSNK